MGLDINKSVMKSKRNIHFNEKKFEQYFFYGIDNRQGLLEGIMFYTNRDINKENVDLHLRGIFPTKKENLDKLRKKLQEKYMQLYRFIYILDGEDNRFNYHLSPEEEEKVKQMVDEIIQQQIDDDKLMITSAGIFFQDRKNEEREEERKKQGKGKGYIDLGEHIWTGEVYEVIQELECMEELDKYQYYKRWLQAKIGRMRASKQYPQEKIKKLEEIYEKFFKPKARIKQKDTDREL